MKEYIVVYRMDAYVVYHVQANNSDEAVEIAQKEDNEGNGHVQIDFDSSRIDSVREVD